MKQNVRVGIGFATGRKSFLKILKTNIYNWRECGLTGQEQISLNLLIAYDLKYSNTRAADYTNVNDKLMDLIDEAYFIGARYLQQEIDGLLEQRVISGEEAALFFTSGYAAKRNAIIYCAVKNRMDYLVFLDDDEYPMAVTRSRSTALWGGQHVLKTHLEHIGDADITNGHHCGYISPIPQIRFNEVLTEEHFRLFVEAISNDIVHWDTVRSIMERGGVTYADTDVLTSDAAHEVEEVGGAKFISGSNLCINLTDPSRVHPFYNPPQARGEDTFLSTCLGESRVLRVPCYTFHDAFSYYKPLISGVLPVALRGIHAESEAVINRFYRACVGWIRYKPLFLYITRPAQYQDTIARMQEMLAVSLPRLCRYFDRPDFLNIQDELVRYHRNVEVHYQQFRRTQAIWDKLAQHVACYA